VRRAASFIAALFAAGLAALSAVTPAAAGAPTWDRVANIKDAAERLALLHRREGSPGVLKFLDACYRTHTLASEFTPGIEACLAQDYMHSQVLVQIYARMPEADRRRLGAPSPELIAKGMGERFVAVFSQYKVPVKEAEDFKKLVDKNGMPLFLKAVFPKASARDDAAGERAR
jgi:hypothetical protein